LDLTLPTQISDVTSKLKDKGKLIAATLSALTATTMAVVTFMSGGGGVDELGATEGVRWNGPVGVLDSDYRHLVTVGKINRAGRDAEYVAGDARDPMVAPSGALRSSQPAKTDGAAAKPAPVTLPNMWLSGIIWDPENPIVMIDGLDLRVGDRIKGARVVEIRMDSVVLSYASKEYVLTVD
jgi:hypothetical protein